MELKYILVLSILIICINPVCAFSKNTYVIDPSEKITLYGGSSYHIYGDNNISFLKLRDSSFHVDNLNNRWVGLWLYKNGHLIDRGVCYNFDYCQIGNIKINIVSIFYGKEAYMFQFNILKVFR